jgi:hypothetical protein
MDVYLIRVGADLPIVRDATVHSLNNPELFWECEDSLLFGWAGSIYASAFLRLFALFLCKGLSVLRRGVLSSHPVAPNRSDISDVHLAVLERNARPSGSSAYDSKPLM